jgi:hypothetical protein
MSPLFHRHPISFAAYYPRHRFMPYYPTRKLTILALDPSVRDDGRILRTQIETPNESLDAGPRVHVIDYDATAGAWRAPARHPARVNCGSAPPHDPFEDAADEKVLAAGRDSVPPMISTVTIPIRASFSNI